MKLRQIVYHGLALSLASTTVSKLSAAAPAISPASVTRAANEADFNTVTLTPKAEERLKIKTVAITLANVPRHRVYGAEVILPLGEAGGELSEGAQSMLSLLPTMTAADRIKVAEAQVEADGVILAAKVQLDAAEVAMARANRMLEEKSGSRRAVDDAQAQLSLAEAELTKAKAKRELLGPPVLANVTPDKIWLRVPVYVGDLEHILNTETANVVSLSARAGEVGVPANPVTAPPSSNAAASSVDLFYTCNNGDQRFQLGQRVGIKLPLDTSGEVLVVPWASVITDIYGGTWVYVNTAEHQFVRQRVQVSRVVGDLAALVSGPAVGTLVVTDGAAELFGTEVGFSK